MRTNLIMGVCAVFIVFLFVAAMSQFVEAGPVVPRVGGSSQDEQAEGLPGLPNYAESADDEETRKRMRRQQQPPPDAPRRGPSPQYGAADGYGQPQMPLPPTYTPGAPASYGQPASAARLPMSPTAYGTYDSPSSFAQPGMGLGYGQMSPGQMAAGQQGGFGLPPSPTAQSPMAVSPAAAAGTQQAFGPHSPSGVRQQTTPQRSVASHHPQSTVPAGSKPFSSYTRQSAYSPYMSLFRYQDSARGINNYYSYVKPALDQRKKNRRIGQEISGLQNSAKYQGLSLQQLNQRNQARQRPGNIIPGSNVPQRMPATFMNTQQYYPGLR